VMVTWIEPDTDVHAFLVPSRECCLTKQDTLP